MATGKTDEIKGRVKEAAGALTGDAKLKREGRIDQYMLATALIVLLFADLPAVALAQSLSCPGIHVKILAIRNSTGTVDCALFDSPVGFPTEFLHAASSVMVLRVRNAQARCDFEDIPPGTYALAVIHDEDSNGKLNTNWLGIPNEGYGFSNDARGLFGPPTFLAASFAYDGRSVDLTISLHY